MRIASNWSHAVGLAVCLCLPAALSACGPAPDPAPPDSPPPKFDYPLDDVLRMNHLQAKGTHNSYHVATAGAPQEYAYTHLPLDRQLGEQGVRYLELDLHYNWAIGLFEVYHLLIQDEKTTCRKLTDCLHTIKGWSDAHRAHHPLVVQFELKDPYPGPQLIEWYFDRLHAEVRSVWPADRIITPDEVQGAHATLAEAVRGEGWPTLGKLRGRVLFMFNNNGQDGFKKAYTHDFTSLSGRLIFSSASPEEPFAAVTIRDDPVAEADQIGAALAANMLVRTRADADLVEPLAGDKSRRDAALASGAQFVSTDFPAPVKGINYSVEIPGGTPSRCNPLEAPAGCTSKAVEDPALVSP